MTGTFGWRPVGAARHSPAKASTPHCHPAVHGARQHAWFSVPQWKRSAKLRQLSSPWALAALATEQPAQTLVASEDDLKNALAAKDVVVVDWMAAWCRKCIYLKPKLEKMFHEEFAECAALNVPLVFVDVNKVPGSVVYSNGIRKMPTIAVYRDGKKVAEHIAAEGGLSALEKVREMMKLTLMD